MQMQATLDDGLVERAQAASTEMCDATEDPPARRPPRGQRVGRVRERQPGVATEEPPFPKDDLRSLVDRNDGHRQSISTVTGTGGPAGGWS